MHGVHPTYHKQRGRGVRCGGGPVAWWWLLGCGGDCSSASGGAPSTKGDRAREREREWKGEGTRGI